MQNQVQEQIKLATGKAPVGWEAVIWKNKMSKNSICSFGFNFQKKGKYGVGFIGMNQHSGEPQRGAICEVVAIV